VPDFASTLAAALMTSPDDCNAIEKSALTAAFRLEIASRLAEPDRCNSLDLLVL
jgi:hypothetical protein